MSIALQQEQGDITTTYTSGSPAEHSPAYYPKPTDHGAPGVVGSESIGRARRQAVKPPALTQAPVMEADGSFCLLPPPGGLSGLCVNEFCVRD